MIIILNNKDNFSDLMKFPIHLVYEIIRHEYVAT